MINSGTILFKPSSVRAKVALWSLWTISPNQPTALEAHNSGLNIVLRGNSLLSTAGCSRAELWSALLNLVNQTRADLAASLHSFGEDAINVEFTSDLKFSGGACAGSCADDDASAKEDSAGSTKDCADAGKQGLCTHPQIGEMAKKVCPETCGACNPSDLRGVHVPSKMSVAKESYIKLCIKGITDYKALDALSAAVHKVQAAKRQRFISPSCPFELFQMLDWYGYYHFRRVWPGDQERMQVAPTPRPLFPLHPTHKRLPQPTALCSCSAGFPAA